MVGKGEAPDMGAQEPMALVVERGVVEVVQGLERAAAVLAYWVKVAVALGVLLAEAAVLVALVVLSDQALAQGVMVVFMAAGPGIPVRLAV
jgi:hypothetical protein